MEKKEKENGSTTKNKSAERLTTKATLTATGPCTAFEPFCRPFLNIIVNMQRKFNPWSIATLQ
jgi:hypothetical protein